MERGFELVDGFNKIARNHQCSKCNGVIVEAHECENRCLIFCEEHLPQSKCEFCGGNFSFNKELDELIKKRYKVRCTNCEEELMLQQFKEHSKKACKRKCTQKCSKQFENQEKLEKHLKEECENSLIRCIGCNKKGKRKEIEKHQENCKKAKTYFDFLSPIKKRMREQKERIESLEQENKEIAERISNLEKDKKRKKKMCLEEIFIKEEEGAGYEHQTVPIIPTKFNTENTTTNLINYDNKNTSKSSHPTLPSIQKEQIVSIQKNKFSPIFENEDYSNLLRMKYYRLCIYCENGKNKENQTKRGKGIFNKSFSDISSVKSILVKNFGDYYSFFLELQKIKKRTLYICSSCVYTLKKKLY